MRFIEMESHWQEDDQSQAELAQWLQMARKGSFDYGISFKSYCHQESQIINICPGSLLNIKCITTSADNGLSRDLASVSCRRI
ncbi:hypothetical protein TNCV_3849421 [Trichonephila clavipes]|uniref:Uncharacterized protein n=1 Tax=Trichonephila clavipes TaxID=2585209 RepID=A0A8X6RD57_TRICX|nr:hypothetical protein TNCV_3849421 [Trichonephila clavipes]